MSEPIVVQYYTAKRFGRIDRIPVSEEFKKILQDISGKTVLDEYIMRGLEKLNVRFEIVPEPGIK